MRPLEKNDICEDSLYPGLLMRVIELYDNKRIKVECIACNNADKIGVIFPHFFSYNGDVNSSYGDFYIKACKHNDGNIFKGMTLVLPIEWFIKYFKLKNDIYEDLVKAFNE